MIRRLICFMLFTGTSVLSYSQDYLQEVLLNREERNAIMRDTATTVLKAEELEKFQGLNFFPADSLFKVEAKIVSYKRRENIQMKTSADRFKDFILYGSVEFVLKDTLYKLNVYQMAGNKGADYTNYLFLPFTDLTSGNESYGGGRYIDLEMNNSDSITIDFNLCYNPYCAYTTGYNCPIPPKENFLNTEIRAGEKKLWEDH